MPQATVMASTEFGFLEKCARRLIVCRVLMMSRLPWRWCGPTFDWPAGLVRLEETVALNHFSDQGLELESSLLRLVDDAFNRECVARAELAG